MQFSSKEDIEAPVDDVFAMLTEFESFERSAMRRGIEVQRLNPSAVPEQGMEWRAKFVLRGKPRDMRLQLETYEPPHLMLFASQTQGLNGWLTLELLALSQRRTRMAVVLKLTPKTLSSRLMIHSLKLTKANLTKRFKLKVADYAKGMEDRHQRMV